MTEQPQDLRTIKATNEFLRSLVETQEVVRDKFWISGEVRDINAKSSLGHVYFILQDADYSIKCMISKRLKDKHKLVTYRTILDVYGSIQLYAKEAEFQIYVEDIQLAQRKLLEYDPSVFQLLKEKGLWPRVKKDLPIPPKNIAVITKEHSAGRYDFEKTYRREGGKALVEVLDVPLETADAPNEIAKCIQAINQAQKADTIVIVRGGGNLVTFNDIRVAEAICQSSIPIITGIGHQTNQTLADRVADESTITPTDAAYKLAKLEPRTDNMSQVKAAVQSNFPTSPVVVEPIKQSELKTAAKYPNEHKKLTEAPQSNFFQTNAIGIIGIFIGILVLIALIFLIFQSL